MIIQRGVWLLCVGRRVEKIRTFQQSPRRDSVSTGLRASARFQSFLSFFPPSLLLFHSHVVTRTIRPNKKLLDRRRRHHQQFLRLEMNPTSRRRKATQVDNKRDRMTLTCSTAPTRLRVGKNLERRKKKIIYIFFFKKDRSLSPFLSEQIFYFPSKKKNNM